MLISQKLTNYNTICITKNQLKKIKFFEAVTAAKENVYANSQCLQLSVFLFPKIFSVVVASTAVHPYYEYAVVKLSLIHI